MGLVKDLVAVVELDAADPKLAAVTDLEVDDEILKTTDFFDIVSQLRAAALAGKLEVAEGFAFDASPARG